MADQSVRAFVCYPSFDRAWRKLRLQEIDWEALRDLLVADPRAGDVMSGSGGARKLRFAPPTWRRGKSGATRVIYYYIELAGTLYLFLIYAKADQEDLSPEQLKDVRNEIEWLKAKKGE